MIAMGFLDEKTLERAIEEARAWYKDPGAFDYWPEVFAAGRVK
jgi:aconitase B